MKLFTVLRRHWRCSSFVLLLSNPSSVSKITNKLQELTSKRMRVNHKVGVNQAFLIKPRITPPPCRRNPGEIETTKHEQLQGDTKNPYTKDEQLSPQLYLQSLPTLPRNSRSYCSLSTNPLRPAVTNSPKHSKNL